MTVGSRRSIKQTQLPARDPSKVHQAPGASASSEHVHPWFSLEHVHGDYCISCCQDSERSALLSKLHRLSRMTWSEIRAADRKSLGFEKIPDSRLNVPVPRWVPSDSMQATRFNGNRCRLLGYRDGRTFHVVWVDRTLSTYDHD